MPEFPWKNKEATPVDAPSEKRSEATAVPVSNVPPNDEENLTPGAYKDPPPETIDPSIAAAEEASPENITKDDLGYACTILRANNSLSAMRVAGALDQIAEQMHDDDNENDNEDEAT